ncbi:hypothetical protein [Saccharopolyspora spinosa]|uniref:hypothetical protein n=1 Tax=Saccharopolyspora spinosa TaxID=60894 RepID=UPI000237A85E|nr:hypothetical protein [Saccharopolyspora spinosa]
MNANLPVGMRKNTPAVARLKKIGELLDALFRELSRVEFLEDDIMQKKDLQEVEDLAGAAQAGAFGVALVNHLKRFGVPKGMGTPLNKMRNSVGDLVAKLEMTQRRN